MQSDINFLPEKERAEKEKKLVKKIPKKIEFYTPKEELKKQPDSSSWIIFSSFFKVLLSKLKFKPKLKPAQEKKLALIPDKKLTKKTEIDVQAKVGHNLRTIQASKPVNITKATLKQTPETNTVEDLTGEFSQVDVNLMPWQDPSLARNKKLRIFVVIASLLLVVAWGTILRINNNNKEVRIGELEESIRVIDKQLENINVELLSQGSVVAIRQNKFIEIYNQLPKWLIFFTWLESKTDQNVYFTNLDVKGTDIGLDILAMDYTSAAKQWLAFETATNWVETVEASDFRLILSTETSEQDKIEFRLDLSLNENVLQSNF